MNLASWKYEAIKLPRCLPLAQTDRLGGGETLRERERERERNVSLTERIEPFSRPTGVGSVLTVIEPKHQLVMRPPRPGVRSSPQEHCPTIAQPPAVCFGCLPAWLAWLLTDCRKVHSCSDAETETRLKCCVCSHIQSSMSDQMLSPQWAVACLTIRWKEKYFMTLLLLLSCSHYLIIKPTAGCIQTM